MMARCLLAVISAIIVAACSYPKAPTGAHGEVAIEEIHELDSAEFLQHASAATGYTIGPFDRLTLSVWQYPDLSGDVLVKEDGTVFLPNAGNISISGMTLREAQNTLTQSLLPFVPRAQLDISPSEIRSNVYYVLGEVNQAGAYPILRPQHLAEAVANAGGFTQNAQGTHAYLSRNGKAYPINLAHSFSSDGNNPIFLQQGDLIYIPSQAEASVYVLGEVANPSAVPLAAGQLGVIKAIAEAGGLTSGASESRVAVIRRVDRKLQLRVVNVSTTLSGVNRDFLGVELQPGDIIWVPPRGITNWNRTLSLITPTLDTLLFRPLGGVRDYFLIREIIDGGGRR